MAGENRWSGYKTAMSTLLSTDLNALASGSTSVLSVEQSNTNTHRFIDIELNLASVNITSTSAQVDVFVVASIDGTNYPEFDVGANPGAHNMNYFVGSVIIDSSSSAHRGHLYDVFVRFEKWKLAVRNQTGIALAASGNTVAFRYKNDSFT